MNKKGLFTAILSLVLVLAGCNSNNNTTEEPSSTPSGNPNKVERVAGNGTSWPEEVQALINKALANDKDPESIPVQFVNAEYYTAEYYETSDAQIGKTTSVLCENSTSFSIAESNQIMTTYATSLEDAGFEIDKSDFSKYGVYYASRKIKGNEYFVIDFGLSEISYNEETYESFYGFILYFGYIKPLATNGWSGTDLYEWPSDEIAELAGNDIPHPSVNYANVSMFGGYNTLVVTNQDNTTSYLDCYVLWLLNTESSLENSYKEQLSNAYWQVNTYEGDSGSFAFNMLSQVVIEFFYMSQSGFGNGLCLFIYINNPLYVFTKSADWPSVVHYLPEYVEENATLSYYYVSISAGLFQTMELLAVGGVAENADELYAAQLTAAGWSVGTEIDQETKEEYYLAIHQSYGECMFYMGTYPDAGITLFIQAAAY